MFSERKKKHFRLTSRGFIFRALGTYFTSIGGNGSVRSQYFICTIMCAPAQEWPDAESFRLVSLSAHQYSKDGTEHAATVATAFYSGTYPGCHGNSKSGRILRRGEARRGAGQWTRWRVFQYPGRSRRIATKCKEKEYKLRKKNC